MVLTMSANCAMNKERLDAIAVRGEQIKTQSAEFLWICFGVRPPLLPDKPVIADRTAANPGDLQLYCTNACSTAAPV